MSLFDKIFNKQQRMVDIRAPEFPDTMTWLNSEPRTIASEKEQTHVVLIDFWAYSCVNCIRTLPHIKKWHETYGPLGLTIIGVHAHEFAFEMEQKNVKAAIERFGITYPVVLDTDRQLWTAYANNVWPRKFLVDAHGTIQYDHSGEGAYADTENAIRILLSQARPDVQLPEPVESEDAEGHGGVCYASTPELYCGYQRGVIGNDEDLVPDTDYEYTDPETDKDDTFSLQGTWHATAESIRYADSSGGYLALNFNGSEVNAVMCSTNSTPCTIELSVNGVPLGSSDAGPDVTITSDGDSILTVTEPRMYHIVQSDRHLLQKTLKMTPTTPTLELFAFTFGGICED